MVRILAVFIALLLATIQVCTAFDQHEGAYDLKEDCFGVRAMPLDENTYASAHDPRTFGLPDGEYNLRFQGYYLTEPEMAGQSVLLDDNQGASSEWEVINHGRRGVTIRNARSGFYLAYIQARPNSLLSMQPKPMYWDLRQQEIGDRRIQIQAQELYHDQILVIDELPVHIDPPLIGLVVPPKSGGQQGWEFKPTVSSQQPWSGCPRLPYRKLFRWWTW
ncbi:hypothetical protein BGZ73_009147 [Actinomortierella ambigua]|nr:hypothetical protein BGZ73_009147 [Actinomortierella ambigua]